MEIKGIKYLGPVFDSSGYAEAGRNYVFALLSQGIPLTIDPVFWDRTPPVLDEKERKILLGLTGKQIDYNVVVLHVVPQNIISPPEEWVKRTGRKVLYEKGKVNILNTVWETDEFHWKWVRLLNHCVDGVIVPCQWNKEVFEKSGVMVPIMKIPHCIKPEKYIQKARPDFYEHNARDKYTFYTIGQWASPCFGCGLGSRKRIEDLIRVFKRMFSGVPDVELVLKIFASDFRLSERSKIGRWIENLKNRINTDPYPNIVLEDNNLSANDMIVLHQCGDCFILLSSGEGFLLPAFEASCVGNPTIIPGYGGHMEFLNDENAFLTNYTKEPVFGFHPARWYAGTMDWVSPDLGHAGEIMKHVYFNPEKAREKGALAQRSIFENLTREKIGKLMVNELNSIIGGKVNV